MKYDNYIKNLSRGFQFDKGEIVLINFFGENKEIEILDDIAIEVAKRGSYPIKLQTSRSYINNYYSSVNSDYLVLPNQYYDLYKIANSVIDVFMYPFPQTGDGFPIDKLPQYRQNLMKMFSTITSNKKYYLQINIPTSSMSAQVNLDTEKYFNIMSKAVDIDYSILRSKTKNLKERLKNTNKVIIQDQQNDMLSFNITNREWYLDDGMGDIPAGEIYVAIIENSANGCITIPSVFIDGCQYLNVKLIFEEGLLIDSSEKKLIDYLDKFGENAKRISEFGIGLNSSIHELTGIQSIDEKRIGTCHIAVGMNNMFGGVNETRIHLDFVFTPKKLYFNDKETTLPELLE